MNQKKAKAIRKALRANGIAPGDVRTEPTKPQFIPAFDGTTQGAWFTGVRRLATGCGRSIYHAAKSIGITRAAA